MKKLLFLLASLFFCTVVFAQSPLYDLWWAARKDIEGKQFIVRQDRREKYNETIERRINEQNSYLEQDYKAIMDGLSAKGFTYNPQNDTVLIVFIENLPYIIGVRIYSNESFMDYGFSWDEKQLLPHEYFTTTETEKYYDQLVYNGEIEKLIADVFKRGVTMGLSLTVAYRIIIENGRIQYPVLSWAYNSFLY